MSELADRSETTTTPDNARPTDGRGRGQRRSAGTFVFGIGVGAFIDGIVLHQLLQWHHLISARPSTVPDTIERLQTNVVADGVFHVAALLAVVVGVAMLMHDWWNDRLAPPWRVHIGLVLAGWAVFNLVEGLVNHQLLRIHHVREDVANPEAWNMGWLIGSAVLLVVGVALARSGSQSTDTSHQAGDDPRGSWS